MAHYLNKREKTILLAQGLKHCCGCDLIKPVSDFSKKKSTNDGLRSRCKACDKIDHDRHREVPENREHEYAVHRDWTKRNKDRCRELDRKWSSQNVARKRYLKTRWHSVHKDTENAKARERMHLWIAENRERHRDNAHKRRAREAGSEGEYTSDQWQMMLSFFNGICPSCDKERKLTRDHIIPVAWGGSTYISNLQPICKKCNSEKGDHYAADYRPSHVRYWAYLEAGERW